MIGINKGITGSIDTFSLLLSRPLPVPLAPARLFCAISTQIIHYLVDIHKQFHSERTGAMRAVLAHTRSGILLSVSEFPSALACTSASIEVIRGQSRPQVPHALRCTHRTHCPPNGFVLSALLPARQRARDEHLRRQVTVCPIYSRS